MTEIERYNDFICLCGENNTVGDELEAWFENYVRDVMKPEYVSRVVRYPVNAVVQTLNWDYDIQIEAVPTDMWSAVIATKTVHHRHHTDEAKKAEDADICTKCGEEAKPLPGECPTSTPDTPRGKQFCSRTYYDVAAKLEDACDTCDEDGYEMVWRAYVQCDVVEHGFLAILKHAVENIDSLGG